MKSRFSRWPPRQPTWISDQDDLAIFDLQVIPMLPAKFRVNWPSRRSEKLIFKMATVAAILDFQWDDFSYF